ncbi:hypothetical protein G7047_23570 [Diaphorobacter sp. HDW4A]|uniref:c-type cytochrome n=1 Tax=Diaphorobacter sp. HDW4A TaxID=2714924 RepID=UPI00140D56AC|nr:hypothetical protein [Diaphorobacter sp. HDW4A]QIL82584.1 hypothetical protein G7047_23570 [Diaphorobacter sp. HDW4A]
MRHGRRESPWITDTFLQLRGILAMLCAALVLVFAYQSASEAANAASTDLRTQDVSVLAATCVTCHAPMSEAGGIPTLQGRSAADLLGRLRAFKAIAPAKADASSTIMPLLLQGFDDLQIKALAQWFSSRKEAR